MTAVPGTKRGAGGIRPDCDASQRQAPRAGDDSWDFSKNRYAGTVSLGFGTASSSGWATRP